ncbi:MAG: hypothetical protein A2Y79_01170 [Deltaproteobacteria bacterium RBG_13_43_22]|nr:MAG: hypothetical protein A2Y79_01170 [Deltaproteobacteria bacterium RBG_13_43_22]
MKIIAASLKQLVCDFADNHRQLTEEITTVKLDESKWTLKEIIGHLIDSASNNHQRITRLQLDEELHFPSYENEKWLETEKWNLLGWPEILHLFKYYNFYLSHLIEKVNPDCLKNRWLGRDRFGERIFSLEELVTDYLRHFKEHLEHFETRLKDIHERKN